MNKRVAGILRVKNDGMFIDDLDNMDLSLGAAPAPATSNKPAVKKPATPMDVDLSGFQSLDMESFSYVPLAEAQKDTSIPIEKEEEDLEPYARRWLNLQKTRQHSASPLERIASALEALAVLQMGKPELPGEGGK